MTQSGPTARIEVGYNALVKIGKLPAPPVAVNQCGAASAAGCGLARKTRHVRVCATLFRERNRHFRALAI